MFFRYRAGGPGQAGAAAALPPGERGRGPRVPARLPPRAGRRHYTRRQPHDPRHSRQRLQGQDLPLAPDVRGGAAGHAGRQQPHDDLLRPVPLLHHAGRGRAHLGCRRRRAPRLQRQLHEPDPGPRAPLGRRGRHRAGDARHVLPRAERARGQAGGAPDPAHPEHGGGPLHQLRHRGDHERGARRARLHGPRQARQVRRRLPRHARLGAGERLAGPGHVGLAQAAARPSRRRRACPTPCSSTP